MSDVKITKNFFLYNGVRYFRGAAENTVLAACGEKKDPIGPRASLTVYNTIPREHLKGRVRHIRVNEIDWNSQSRGEVETEGKLNYFTVSGSGTGTFSYEKAKSARLRLTKFVIDEGDLKAMLNRDAGAARKFLADTGKDGRVVSGVFVVLEGQLEQSFATAVSSGGSVSASLTKAAELQVTANHAGGKSGSTTITLARHSSFAYVLHKVKKWNRDKTVIEELELDTHGMG
jgi:hypothetical protein